MQVLPSVLLLLAIPQALQEGTSSAIFTVQKLLEFLFEKLVIYSKYMLGCRVVEA